MDSQLGLADAVSVGMYLQTFLLEVTKLGLGSCVEVSVAGYPEVLRRELDIEERWTVLCGVAVGYEDTAFGANRLRIEREGVKENVVFLED